MADTPFVGGSYNLDSRPASVQRTVNMMPVPNEPGNERAGWVFRDVPGLVAIDQTEFVTPPPPPIEGLFYANFEDGLPTDLTEDPAPYVMGESAVISGGAYKSLSPPTITAGAVTTWTADKFEANLTSGGFTIEGVVNRTTVADASRRLLAQLSWGVTPATDNIYNLYLYSAAANISFSDKSDPTYLFGNIRDATGTASGVDTHFALVVPEGLTPTARLYVAGAYIGESVTGVPIDSDTPITLLVGNPSDQGDENYSLKWLKITMGELYTGTGSFTPPDEAFQ